MKPGIDTRARQTLIPARRPEDEELKIGRKTELVPMPVAPEDLAADAALENTRGKRGPNAATLELTQQVLALRADGHSVNEIAELLGVASSTVTGWITRHRRRIAGDVIDRKLDEIAVPLAVENLIHGLIAGDKDYTLKTLEGRGKFKRHAEGDAKPPATLPVLTINFSTPETRGESVPLVDVTAVGKILGVAAGPGEVGKLAAPTPAALPDITTTALPTPDAPARVVGTPMPAKPE